MDTGAFVILVIVPALILIAAVVGYLRTRGDAS